MGSEPLATVLGVPGAWSDEAPTVLSMFRST